MTTKTNSNVLTSKEIANLKKVTKAYQDSFKNASRLFLELATTDKVAKKVCGYLGLTADSLKCKVIADTRRAVLAKLPCYYLIEGSDIHQPAKLVKIPGESGLNAYVASKCSYIDALAELALLLSRGNRYESHKVELPCIQCVDGIHEGTAALYNKDYSPAKVDITDYLQYLDFCTQASKQANEQRKRVLAELQNN